jgi:hypothetical protein
MSQAATFLNFIREVFDFNLHQDTALNETDIVLLNISRKCGTVP